MLYAAYPNLISSWTSLWTSGDSSAAEVHWCSFSISRYKIITHNTIHPTLPITSNHASNQHHNRTQHCTSHNRSHAMTVADTIQHAAQSAKEAVGLGSAASAESKSARKKKAKAEAAATNGTSSSSTALPKPASQENSVAVENTTEQHEYLKELNKQIRNTNKKLQGTQKVDAILEANPGVSLDELVAQRKINQDQKEQAQKKPKLQAQLAELEERAEHYRAFDAKYQELFAKQREELTAEHERNTSKLREDWTLEGASSARAELRKKLLTFSQFLRAAAAKRAAEEETDTEESRAFEGALLLVYGGDEKAVDAAVNLIEGSQEPVPAIDGLPTRITCKFTLLLHRPSIGIVHPNFSCASRAP